MSRSLLAAVVAACAAIMPAAAWAQDRPTLAFDKPCYSPGANDRTRIDAGAPPEQQFAAAQFTLSRFGVRLARRGGGTPRAALPMRVQVIGWTHTLGEVLYLHYRRGGGTVKSVRLGAAAGDCGDRTVTLRRGLPRGARPGRYQLVVNTSARGARSKPRMTMTQRLR